MRIELLIPPAHDDAARTLAGLHAATADPEWDRPWSAGEFRTLLASESGGCAAAICRQDDGAPAGFALWRALAGEAELLFIGVLPSFRGQGAGGLLLEAFLRHARENGAGVMFLELRDGNEAAGALYRKYGFSVTGERRDYFLSASRQKRDALLLSRPAERI